MKRLNLIIILAFSILSCGPKHGNKKEITVPIEDNLRFGSIQNFVIDNTKDTSIILKSGSVWSIQAGSFIDSLGTDVTGNVEIIICEYTTLADCLFEGLSTVSDKGVLQTAGMFYFMPNKDKKKLKLKKSIAVKYKSGINKLKEPKLFKGKNEKGTIIWTEDTATVKDKLLVQYRPGEVDTFYAYTDGRYITEIMNKDTLDVWAVDPDESVYYFFELIHTGWVNVDQYENPSEKPIYVKRDNSKMEEPVYYLLVSNSTVLVRSFFYDTEKKAEKFEFLPDYITNEDRSVYAICFSYNKNGSCTYAVKSINPSDGKVNEFNETEYKTVELNKFKEDIAVFLEQKIIPSFL